MESGLVKFSSVLLENILRTLYLTASYSISGCLFTSWTLGIDMLAAMERKRLESDQSFTAMFLLRTLTLLYCVS